MSLISIIIPVFNAQDTITISLNSLLNQSYTHLELIFVNDASIDSSELIITEFKPQFTARGMSCKIISHETNQGVAVARNTGLANATGDYIYYVDADDAIEPNTLALLINKAASQQADIVGCNWFLTFENNERKMNQPAFNTALEAIQLMLAGLMRWNLWLFLVKRDLYTKNQIQFEPGMNMGEDIMVMMKLFCHANKVAFVDQALYHYGQTNTQSLTKTYHEGHIKQVTYNVKEVEHYLMTSVYKDQIGDGIDFLKLNIKLPLLISSKKSQYLQWLNWFPEANAKVMLNKSLPLRTRLLQKFAVNRQFIFIKMYYYLVIKFIYGIIYK